MSEFRFPLPKNRCVVIHHGQHYRYGKVFEIAVGDKATKVENSIDTITVSDEEFDQFVENLSRIRSLVMLK